MIKYLKDGDYPLHPAGQHKTVIKIYCKNTNDSGLLEYLTLHDLRQNKVVYENGDPLRYPHWNKGGITYYRKIRLDINVSIIILPNSHSLPYMTDL